MESSAAVEGRNVLKAISRYWWLWIVFGIAWMVVAAVILQFDEASVTTVGAIIGFMFLGAAVQQFAIAGLVDRGKWLFAIFGVLFVGAAVAAFVSPEDTFAALADMLGFLFLIVGVFWLIQAFSVRETNELWWLGLISGAMMVVLAFWTAGQFFIDKAYVLLVFAGIWALMQGFTDIVRAFQIRRLGDIA